MTNEPIEADVWLNADGEFWTASIAGLRISGEGTSRSLDCAVAYALEDLAERLRHRASEERRQNP